MKVFEMEILKSILNSISFSFLQVLYINYVVLEIKGKKSEESVSVVELTDVLFLFFRCLRVQSHV